jgi:hypothetical protein
MKGAAGKREMLARRSQEPGNSQQQPGGGWRSQEEPGRARRNKEEPEGARRTREQLGGARWTQEELVEAPRGSYGAPRGP